MEIGGSKRIIHTPPNILEGNAVVFGNFTFNKSNLFGHCYHCHEYCCYLKVSIIHSHGL